MPCLGFDVVRARGGLPALRRGWVRSGRALLASSHNARFLYVCKELLQPGHLVVKAV